MKEHKSTYLKVILISAGILLGGILLGAVLLTLAYCIPVNINSYFSTELSAELQGWYPNVPNITNTFNTYFQTYLPGVLDNVTVRTFILPLTYANVENPLYAAMSCDGYSYYWHGYVVITRILQVFFNLEQIQMAGSFLQIAMVVILAVLLEKKKGMKYAVMLVSTYVLMMPMALAVCLQYYPIFFIAFGAGILLLSKQDWFEKENRLFYFFLVVGMLTSYFDLLTYPLLTWGLPMVWWMVISNNNNTIITALKRVVVLGMAWIIGYGGMWFGKWLLASVVLQKNIIWEALKEVILRSGVDEMVAFGQTSRFHGIYMNWMHYTYKIYIVILAAWLLYWLLSGFLFGWRKISAARCISYLLIGASGIVWYMVLLNHTEVHHAFTYRIFAVCIAVFFAVVLESTEYETKKWKLSHSLRFCGVGIGLMAVAILLTLCAKEITPVNNKNCAFETRLAKQEELQIRFVPKYDRILAIGIGFKTESTTGQYEIELRDGDKVLYEETIPVSYYESEVFKDYVVDWRLSAGKEYNIVVRIEDTDKEVYAYYTEEGFLPLAGCQYLQDGEPVGSQPLMGLQYWCLPESLKTLVFWAITYWGFLWVIAYSVYCVWESRRKEL